MIVIYRPDHFELIKSPQDIEQAWQLADQLTSATGVNHYATLVEFNSQTIEDIDQ